MNNFSERCFKSWLEVNNETTLQDANNQFTVRHIGGITFASVLMVLGFFGNVMVLWVYVRRFKPCNYRLFTICLAVMDISNCCTGMPFLIYYMSHYWIFPSNGLCKFGRFMMSLTTNCSAYILLVIACARFRTVCRPMKWQISRNQALVCCIGACVVGVLTSWPTLLLFGIYTKKDVLPGITAVRCWTEDKFVHTNYPSVYFITMCTVMVSIMVILIAVYFKIVRFLHGHRTKSINSKTQNTTITLLAVTAAFLLSEIPYYGLVITTRILKNFNCNMTFSEGFAYYTFVFSVLLNNAVNPFIYGFLDKKFRREVKSLFRKPETLETGGSSS